MANKLRPLTYDEVSPIIGDQLVFDFQTTILDRKKGLKILRICRNCERPDWVPVSQIRAGKRWKHGPTGLCPNCNARLSYKEDALRGSDHPSWKGGRREVDGYTYVWDEDTKAMVAEHRLLMSRILGRPLLPGENIHHKNRIKTDNRPENLELWVTSQPYGARVTDLIDYVVSQFPITVLRAFCKLPPQEFRSHPSSRTVPGRG